METARMNRSTLVSQSSASKEGGSYRVKKQLQELQKQIDIQEIEFNNKQEDIS